MEKGDVLKIDFTDEVSPGKEISIQATVMLLENSTEQIPKVVYLKTHDGHTSDAKPGDVLRVKKHVLGSSVPASLHVYEVKVDETEEDDDVAENSEQDPTNVLNKNKNLHPGHVVQKPGDSDKSVQDPRSDKIEEDEDLSGPDPQNALPTKAPQSSKDAEKLHEATTPEGKHPENKDQKPLLKDVSAKPTGKSADSSSTGPVS